MRARMEGVRVQCLFRPMAVVDGKYFQTGAEFVPVSICKAAAGFRMAIY